MNIYFISLTMTVLLVVPGCLVKGYSNKLDSARLVGEYWMLAAKQKLHIHVDRVGFKSNPADDPSRWHPLLPCVHT
eukprot:2630888-Amphidinium_carterae.2